MTTKADPRRTMTRAKSHSHEMGAPVKAIAEVVSDAVTTEVTLDEELGAEEPPELVDAAVVGLGTTGELATT
jgi:hypothetical protein